MFNNPPLLVEEVYCPRCSQLVDTLLFAYYILLLYYYNSNRTSVAIYIYIEDFIWLSPLHTGISPSPSLAVTLNSQTMCTEDTEKHTLSLSAPELTQNLESLNKI